VREGRVQLYCKPCILRSWPRWVFNALFYEGYRSINSIRAVRNKHSSLATELIVRSSLENAGGSRSELLCLVASSTLLKSDRAESYTDFNEFWNSDIEIKKYEMFTLSIAASDSAMVGQSWWYNNHFDMQLTNEISFLYCTIGNTWSFLLLFNYMFWNIMQWI